MHKDSFVYPCIPAVRAMYTKSNTANFSYQINIYAKFQEKWKISATASYPHTHRKEYKHIFLHRLKCIDKLFCILVRALFGVYEIKTTHLLPHKT